MGVGVASQAGPASYARVFNRASTIVLEVEIGAGKPMTMLNYSVASGANVTISSFVINEGNG
jgi:hypothetical protein